MDFFKKFLNDSEAPLSKSRIFSQLPFCQRGKLLLQLCILNSGTVFGGEENLGMGRFVVEEFSARFCPLLKKIPGSFHIHRRERFDLTLGRFIGRQRDGRAYL
jgi:hypothetical protein